MEEVGGGVPICGGDDKPAMKTCGRDDRDATCEGVPSTSRARPGRTVEEVEAGVVDADVGVDTCEVDRRWATQPRSVIGRKKKYNSSSRIIHVQFTRRSKILHLGQKGTHLQAAAQTDHCPNQPKPIAFPPIGRSALWSPPSADSSHARAPSVADGSVGEGGSREAAADGAVGEGGREAAGREAAGQDGVEAAAASEQQQRGGGARARVLVFAKAQWSRPADGRIWPGGARWSVAAGRIWTDPVAGKPDLARRGRAMSVQRRPSGCRARRGFRRRPPPPPDGARPGPAVTKAAQGRSAAKPGRHHGGAGRGGEDPEGVTATAQRRAWGTRRGRADLLLRDDDDDGGRIKRIRRLNGGAAPGGDRSPRGRAVRKRAAARVRI